MEGHGQDLEEPVFFSVMENGILLLPYNSIFQTAKLMELKVLLKLKKGERKKVGRNHMDHHWKYFGGSRRNYKK